MKSRGADAVFDYHDPDCAAKIREYSNNSLRYIFDTISTKDSFPICAAAFPAESTEELQLVALLPLDGWTRTDVTTTVVLAYTSIGEAFSKFGMDVPPIPEHYEWASRFWKIHAKFLAEGKIKPHPVAKREGGLAAVPNG